MCWLSLDAWAANPQTVVVPLPATTAHLAPLGRFAPTNPLNLVIGLPWRDPAGLSELLRQINDPASTNYHHYLTPQQFAERFGPTAADYQAVTDFAQSHGLRVTGTHPNRVLLDVAGSVTDVERSLHVTMHTYRHPTENRTFFAPDTQPSLDLGVPVLGISGLDNYELPHPHYKVKSLAVGHDVTANLGSGPGSTYLGGDFRAAYVPDSTLTGAGQTLGLLQFDGYTPADITYYEHLAGIPSVPLQNVLIDGFDGYPSGSGGEVEVSLDIEMSVSMAPGLSKIIVYEAPQGGSWHDILNRMATDDLARQISCSWYIPNGPADPVADQIWEEMAAQGQTFFTASGDDDAYTGLINFPNDSPYVTEVGGTTLKTSGAHGTWTGETVWNWGGLSGGSGGGISTQYTIPTWQTNISMVANQGSPTKRNIPDVALTADNVYVRADGRDYDDIGGTSCASPLWAAFAALVNQQAAASGQPAIGFLNPALDVIGKSAAYATCFHDITTGNNESPSSPTRFSAVPGYDLCTGWGTPAGQNLINALANPEPLLITPVAGFSSSGRVGGPFTTTTQNLILTNAGKYGLAWALSNTSAWLNVSSTNGYLLPGGAAATVTVSLNATAAKLPIGTNVATLWFTNVLDRVGQGRVFSLAIIAPPVITAQPTNQSVLDGETAAFSVSVIGGQPLAYQWRDNGTNLVDNGEITGSATSNLVLTAVSVAQAGNYSVVITNAAGQAVSLGVQLTVPSSPPVFTAEPTNVTVYAGRSAQFAVAVVGTKPYAYQWQVNASPILGATNATLTLTNLQVSQSGDYSVQVSNTYGITNSMPVVLTVNPPPPCAPVSVGMVGWWSGEGNADDSVGTNNGTLVGEVAFAPGEVGQAFSFDGGDYVLIPDSPSLDSLTTNMTIEAWIKVAQFSDQDWISMVSKGDASWELRRFGTGSTLSFWTAGLSTPELESTRNINDGQWHHVAGVYDGTNKYIYVDGTLDVSTPASGSIARDGDPLAVGDSPDNGQRAFDGAIDEVSLYDRALSAGEIETIYVAGIGGKCPVPITIATQPTNETVWGGDTVTWTVEATGSQPLNYQWNFYGNAIYGATNATFTLENVQPTNAGIYTVTVSNPQQSLTSSNALLTVLTHPPIIGTQPVSQTNYIGSTVVFSVTAGGSPPLSYQWSFNSVSIGGATNATLTLSNVQLDQSGNYYVQVSNPYGTNNSAVAVLSIILPPSCAPAPPGMVDWWTGQGTANDSVGTNNGVLAGGATFAPGLVGQAFSLNGSDYVAIPDSASLDSLTTNITIDAWIKVNEFSSQNWISIICKGDSSWELRRYGSTSTLSFWTAGLSTPELQGSRNVNDGQWHHVAGVYDGTNKYLYVDGTLDASTPATGSIVASGDPLWLGDNPDEPQRFFEGLVDEVSLYNRALSTAEIRAIYAAGAGGKCLLPLAITVQPTNEYVNAGDTADFTVVAEGMQPLLYQWSFAGSHIVGATNAVLTMEDAQPSMNGLYAVTVSDPFGSVTSSNVLLSVLAQSPTIISQPVSQTNYVGSTLSFSASVGGTPPLNYQWSFDSTNLVGATNATLTLNNVQLAQAGDYAVTVTNVFGSATSSNALLTVLTQPPTIITQPVSETNYEGTTATFSVAVGGTAPLSYQWTFNSIDLSGATNATLMLTNVRLSQAGAYSVMATNLYGAATSSIVDLTVISSGSCAPPAPGLISWWPAEGTANDIIGTNNGTLVGVVAYAPGKVGQAFSFNGGDYVSIPDSPSLDALTTNLTVEAWVNVTQFSSQDWISFVSKGDFAWELRRYGTSSTASFWTKNVSNPELEGTRNIADGKWHHIAGVYDGTSKYLYVDGTLDVSEPATGPIATNTEPLAIGDSPDNTARALDGLVDEVSVYKRALSASEIAAIYNAGSAGKCLSAPVPPSIASEPTNETVIADGTATFAVVAGGTPPLSYAWSFNGTNLVGATNAILVLPNIQLDQAGEYSVKVANLAGLATSSNAILTVIPEASCTPPPAGLVSWWTGQNNANDSVGANDGTLVGGVTYAPGEVGQAFSLNGGDYVAIPDSASIDALTTNITIEAWIKVAQFSGQDWISIICKGDSSWELRRYGSGSTLSFWTAGLSTPDLEGSRNVNDGQWHHVAGVYDGTNKYLYVDGTLDASTPATGSIAASGDPLWVGDNPDAPQRYFDGLVDEVSLYNRALSASQIAAIYAAGSGGKCPPGPPEIVSQPTNETDAVGGTATFSVGVSGSAPITYQWTFNTTNLAGATNNTLVLTNVPLAAAGNYAVLVANPFGSVISSNAVLTVLAPPVITSQPASQTNFAGTAAVFSVTAKGSLPLNYQWEKNGQSLNNGGNVSGATTPTLALADVRNADAGSYSVMVTNAAGSVNSSPALLVLFEPPVIVAQPTSQAVTLSSNVIFNVTAGGASPLIYQWNFDGTNVATATNSSLILTDVQRSQAGTYSVLVTNSFGSVMSSNAVLVVNPLYRFVWSPILSPRFVNTPFAVVVQAQNASNGIATNFASTVALQSTNGLVVTPAISANFVQGVWTGAVTVAQSATNLVLRATDSLGDSGLANPINVMDLPAVTTVASDGTMLILWPTTPSGFILETTLGLFPANWVPVTSAPFPIGDQYLLPLTTSGTNAFYRLRFTGQ